MVIGAQRIGSATFGSVGSSFQHCPLQPAAAMPANWRGPPSAMHRACSRPLVLLCRAADGFVDFANRALDLGLVEIVGARRRPSTLAWIVDAKTSSPSCLGRDRRCRSRCLRPTPTRPPAPRRCRSSVRRCAARCSTNSGHRIGDQRCSGELIDDHARRRPCSTDRRSTAAAGLRAAAASGPPYRPPACQGCPGR